MLPVPTHAWRWRRVWPTDSPRDTLRLSMLGVGDSRDAVERREGATVNEIYQLLGEHVTAINIHGSGGAVHVHAPFLCGVDDPADADQRLFLAGRTPSSMTEVEQLLAEAVDRAAPGVVLKVGALDRSEVEEACSHVPIAVLLCDESLSWRSIDDLVRVACRSVGVRSSGPSSSTAELFDLANEIAYAVGGAVTIEDVGSQLIAYSSLPHQEIDEGRRRTILGRRVPGEMRQSTEDVHEAAGVIHLNATYPGQYNRMAVAVRYGQELLATIWVIEIAPLGSDAEQALREAAVITAVRLMRSRDSSNPERRARIEALMSLLNGAQETEGPSRLLGLRDHRAYSVLALCLSCTNETDELSATRLLEVAGVYCGAWQPSSVCVVAGTTVYALMPLSTTDGSAHLKRVATDIVRTAARTAGIEVRAAVGTVVQHPDQISQSRRIADTVLAAINDPDSPKVATADDVRSRVVLTSLRTHTREVFALGPSPVDQLLQYDREHSTQLAQSLLAWLDALGDFKSAAAELFVHENTLRYRVRKIEERFDLNLADPYDRLVAWLELRLQC